MYQLQLLLYLADKHDLCNTQERPSPLYLDNLRDVEYGARCGLDFERDGDDTGEMAW